MRRQAETPCAIERHDPWLRGHRRFTGGGDLDPTDRLHLGRQPAAERERIHGRSLCQKAGSESWASRSGRNVGPDGWTGRVTYSSSPMPSSAHLTDGRVSIVVATVGRLCRDPVLGCGAGRGRSRCDVRALRRPVTGGALDVEAPASLVPEHGSGYTGRPGLAGHRPDGTGWAPRFTPVSATADTSHVAIVGRDDVAGLNSRAASSSTPAVCCAPEPRSPTSAIRRTRSDTSSSRFPCPPTPST